MQVQMQMQMQQMQQQNMMQQQAQMQQQAMLTGASSACSMHHVGCIPDNGVPQVHWQPKATTILSRSSSTITTTTARQQQQQQVLQLLSSKKCPSIIAATAFLSSSLAAFGFRSGWELVAATVASALADAEWRCPLVVTFKYATLKNELMELYEVKSLA